MPDCGVEFLELLARKAPLRAVSPRPGHMPGRRIRDELEHALAEEAVRVHWIRRPAMRASPRVSVRSNGPGFLALTSLARFLRAFRRESPPGAELLQLRPPSELVFDPIPQDRVRL